MPGWRRRSRVTWQPGRECRPEFARQLENLEVPSGGLARTPPDFFYGVGEGVGVRVGVGQRVMVGVGVSGVAVGRRVLVGMGVTVG